MTFHVHAKYPSAATQATLQSSRGFSRIRSLSRAIIPFDYRSREYSRSVLALFKTNLTAERSEDVLFLNLAVVTARKVNHRGRARHSEFESYDRAHRRRRVTLFLFPGFPGIRNVITWGRRPASVNDQ